MATLKSPRWNITTYQQQLIKDGIPINWQMTVVFEDQDQMRLKQLMRVFCSAERMAYNYLRKDMKQSDIYHILRNKFVLSGRYTKDTIFSAKMIVASQKKLLTDHIKNKKRRLRRVNRRLKEVKKPAKKRNYEQAKIRIMRELEDLKTYKDTKSIPPAIFGSKKRFYQRLRGTLSAEEWRYSRTNHLVTQGEKARKGNQLTRLITGSELPINHPDYDTESIWLRVSLPRVGGGQSDYIYGQIKISSKLPLDLLILENKAYNVRLIQNKETTVSSEVNFDEIPDYITAHVNFKLEIPATICNFDTGTIGIDFNPDETGITEVNEEGNPLFWKTIKHPELTYSSHFKRQHKIGEVVQAILALAKAKNKGLTIESLKFAQKAGSKKFNRMAHNFVYSTFLEQLKRQAVFQGIPVREINPAYTSIIGLLKYCPQYALSRQTAAALVIARRGLGLYKERLSRSLRDFLGSLPTSGRNSYDPSRKYRNWGLWRLLQPHGTTPDASKLLWRSSRAVPPMPVAEELDVFGLVAPNNPLERNNNDAVQQQKLDPG